MKPTFKTPQEALRYHVSGAIERGEGEAIVEIPAMQNTKHTDAQILDTYSADLLNESSPRRELVTEIQFSDGDLLCYASPQYAKGICDAINSHEALVDALEWIVEYIGEHEESMRDFFTACHIDGDTSEMFWLEDAVKALRSAGVEV